MEKRAANAASEKKVQFKILMDQLQSTFRDALRCIVEEGEAETQKKMYAAMNMVLDKLKQEAEV